ncbi:glycoside hydrolase family 113 [Geobacillus zalihae]|uniref:glycoside hydrolase family 113 n=1 Tax=Geobacillus zalihae TaxID=213419 RepID=UPI001681A41C|nr:1,4-beta-xylanase [Geobacillus zalihae]QNU26216.1 1,4-beta-xylanase [Geobacillus zalihae]
MGTNWEIKSFNFVTWDWSKDVELDQAKREIDEMVKRCAINTVTFAFAARQEHCYSTYIDWKSGFMPNLNELSELIHYAKSKGLKTIVKPMVNVNDGYWRAYIRFFDEDVPCEPKWSDWFRHYYEYMLAYGQFCEQNGVDMLIIGCEMVGTDHREQEWRYLISQLRQVYGGALTYNCDKYQEHNVKWWDALDYISSSGYYPKGMIENELERIEQVVRHYGKPFFFAEAGCPAVVGASAVPNDWKIIDKGIPSEKEQADYYTEFLSICAKKEFISGFCFWDWPIKSPATKEEIEQPGQYSIKWKQAEQIVAHFYRTH